MYNLINDCTVMHKPFLVIMNEMDNLAYRHIKNVICN